MIQHRDEQAVKPFEVWWPTLVDATHAIISGGKGSGKTTTTRAVMLELAHQGARFVIIDPHNKLNDWGPGIVPLAAGRRFNEARRAFAWANIELDKRFKARSDVGRDDFPLIVFVIDEFDLFTDRRPDVPEDLRNLASRFLSMIGDESRKVAIRLLVIAHGTEVRNLGVEGRGSKRDNYTIIQLRRGPDQQPEPTGTLITGSARWTIDTTRIPAYADGVLTPDLLVELPDDDALAAPDDPEVLRRRIAELERQLKEQRPPKAKTEVKIERVEVPVISDAQVLQLSEAIRPIVEGLARLQHAPGTEQPSAKRPTRPVAKQPAPSKGKRPAPSQTKPPSVMNEMEAMLALPLVENKIQRVRERFKNDSAAQGYVLSTLRLLWRKQLTPKDIAEGRGAASTRTIERRTLVCEALVREDLLVKHGAAYTVNHPELKRIKQLYDAVAGP